MSSVFTYTPVELGGWGLEPNQISIFLALAGASQALWMLGPFTPLQKRFGTGGVLRGCAFLWPFFMAAFPLMNEARRHLPDLVFWIVMPTMTVIGSAVAMAFSESFMSSIDCTNTADFCPACTQLAINDVAPSPNTLGALNAIGLTVQSAVRAVTPVLASALYEWGVREGWLDGHLFWVVIIAVCIGLIVGARFLPPQAEGKTKKPATGEAAGP